MPSARADAMGGVTAMRLLITGAAGFLGRYTAAAAAGRGHRVRALVRTVASAPPEWSADPGFAVSAIDLAGRDAAIRLSSAVGEADAVIHLAAAMKGDDARHARETLRGTQALFDAIVARPDRRPTLVLVSSIAVYATLLLAEGSVLDETTPIETNGAIRDPYCRSKLAQEAIAARAAEDGLRVRIMRPGAIFGPGRLWNDHLGIPLGPAVVRLGCDGQVPVSYVEHCAEALVLAAERPLAHDDRPDAGRAGCIEIINVLDDDLPDRRTYLAALARSGWPRVILPGSWRLLGAPSSVLMRLVPTAHVPGLLRAPVLHARMKPMTYANARLHQRLGWHARFAFDEAMRRSVERADAGERDAYAA